VATPSPAAGLLLARVPRGLKPGEQPSALASAGLDGEARAATDGHVTHRDSGLVVRPPCKACVVHGRRQVYLRLTQRAGWCWWGGGGGGSGARAEPADYVSFLKKWPPAVVTLLDGTKTARVTLKVAACRTYLLGRMARAVHPPWAHGAATAKEMRAQIEAPGREKLQTPDPIP